MLLNLLLANSSEAEAFWREELPEQIELEFPGTLQPDEPRGQLRASMWALRDRFGPRHLLARLSRMLGLGLSPRLRRLIDRPPEPRDRFRQRSQSGSPSSLASSFTSPFASISPSSTSPRPSRSQEQGDAPQESGASEQEEAESEEREWRADLERLLASAEPLDEVDLGELEERVKMLPLALAAEGYVALTKAHERRLDPAVSEALLSRAVACFEQALAAAPNGPELLRSAAHACSELAYVRGLHSSNDEPLVERADRYFQQCLRIDPEDATARYMYGTYTTAKLDRHPLSPSFPPFLPPVPSPSCSGPPCSHRPHSAVSGTVARP